jgi:branched-subunit amino acid ABC-type transport system permease component
MEAFLQRIAQIDWSRWSGPALSALRIVLIIVAAWVAIAVLQRTVRGIRVRVANPEASTRCGAPRRWVASCAT